jgi:hypothetical protein
MSDQKDIIGKLITMVHNYCIGKKPCDRCKTLRDAAAEIAVLQIKLEAKSTNV